MFRRMSDIKVVLYKENRAPKSIALSSRMVYRTLFAVVLFGLMFIVVTGLAARFYWLHQVKGAHSASGDSSVREESSDDSESAAAALKDKVEELEARIKNTAAIEASPKEIDKSNPALALFPPIVTDKTQSNDVIAISNFRYTKSNGKDPSTLSFDLNNSRPGEASVKGYIVVLARNGNNLYSYPNVFSPKSPYLLDFQRGETFNVSRFRQVNAQFETNAGSFQVFIFSRAGELLINKLHEVPVGTP